MDPNLAARDRSIGSALIAPALVIAIVSSLLAVYAFALHPWMMSWGSTVEEQSMALPGDELPLDGKHYFTRAITINAPAPVVWQWLVQLGQDRAGFYSNDYLENLTGANIHNSNEIRQEWQQRKVGDAIPMSRPDILGGALGDSVLLRVTALEPGRMMTTADGSNVPERYFVLPVDDHTTRLLLREQYMTSTMGEIGATWIFDPMHFVMEQRMLQGIKERAEGQPLVPETLGVIAALGWLGAGIVVVRLFSSRPSWGVAGLLCAGAMVPSLLAAGDLNSALAGFLALGISVLGLLMLGRVWLLIFPLIAAFVLLFLLLTPDSWTAFGLLFDLGFAVALPTPKWLSQREDAPTALREYARY